VNVDGATVCAETFFQTGGRFSFTDVPEGRLEIVVDAAEGRATEKFTSIPSGQTISIALRSLATIRGTIVDARGAPLADAYVVAMPDEEASSSSTSTSTDARGVFVFDRLDPGKFTLRADGAEAVPIELTSGAVVDVGRLVATLPEKEPLPED